VALHFLGTKKTYSLAAKVGRNSLAVLVKRPQADFKSAL